jgi:heat shock protein HslJ
VDVVGRAWVVVEIDGSAVEGARPTLELGGDGRGYGSTAVNRWAGSYSLDGDVLTFGPAVSTRMAGPPEAMATESAFLAALGQPFTVTASAGGAGEVGDEGAGDAGDRVVLAAGEGSPVLVLVAAPDAEFSPPAGSR